MGISDYSSNAILSKTHAMYAKHLTTEDFNSLMECENVSEVMAYLKNHTKYADILAPFHEDTIHRGQLEPLLRHHLFFDFADLCRYEISVGEKFAIYFIEQIEIEQILHFINLLNCGRSEEYIYSLPLYFDKNTSIDLRAFPRIKSFNELVDFLEKSRYYKILKPFKIKRDERPDIARIEHALYTYLYGTVLDIIGNDMSGSAQKEMFNIFFTHIDLLNFMYIHRLKKFYKFEPDEIKPFLFPRCRFTPKQINSLCTAESTDERFKILMKTQTGHTVASLKYNYAYEMVQRADYKIAKQYMTFSSNPVVVMMSYINLMRIEISNIVNIVEAIRYNRPIDEIKRILYIN